MALIVRRIPPEVLDNAVIAFGLDRSGRAVVLSADTAAVAQVAGTLTVVRPSGRYRVHVEPGNTVLLNGTAASNGDELVGDADLQLGANGPRLRLTVTATADDCRTPLQQSGTRTRLQELQAGMDRLRASLLRVRGNLDDVRQSYARIRHRIGRYQASVIGLGIIIVLVCAVAGPRLLEHFRLTRVLEQIKPSVFLVVKDGTGMGTAWVVDDGKLATNAHVAEACMPVDGRCTQSLEVMSVGRHARSHLITHVAIHPGYDEFPKVLAECDPRHGKAEGKRVALGSLKVCDVAILFTEPPTPLGVRLRLADRDDVAHLAVSSAVGTVTFPLMGVKSQDVMADVPTPNTFTDEVSNLTNEFLVEPESGVWTIMQHGLTTSPGSSGSPVMAPNGTVVALHSAGNREHDGTMERETGIQIKYAQHVDFLRELLEGTASANLAGHVERWRRELRARWVCAVPFTEDGASGARPDAGVNR